MIAAVSVKSVWQACELAHKKWRRNLTSSFGDRWADRTRGAFIKMRDIFVYMT